MSAMITIWTDEKHYTQCNARCYGSASKDERCTCICGGMNHRVGHEQAVENTKLHWKEWLNTFMASNEVYNFEVSVLYDFRTKTASAIARMLNLRFKAQGVFVTDVRRERRKALRAKTQEGRAAPSMYRRYEWIVEFSDDTRLVFHKKKKFEEFVSEPTAARQLPLV